MQVGDFGETFEVDTRLDLRTATVLKARMAYRDPETRAVLHQFTRDLTGADLVTGTTGTVAIPLLEGDLVTDGNWRIQVWDLTPGRVVHSAVGTIYVAPNITPDA